MLHHILNLSSLNIFKNCLNFFLLLGYYYKIEKLYILA